ncbi:hypothetical protein EGW08_007977, partial [Elysia chlorotica]
DYLQHPEDAACVPVVVVAKGNVLHTSAVPQEPFHMLEEPRLVVVADSNTHLARFRRVHHVAQHEHGLSLRVDERLHELVVSVDLRIVEQTAQFAVADHWLVLHPHVLAGRHDAQLCGHQEAQGAVRPGDGVEQVWVLILRSKHN